jgi:aryl-alcohol dehydrogenase-like predicted oxidoreductase
MKYNRLGSSDINVSRVCLGTMTWGTQNTQQDANEQIDYAISEGVNFLDTAEMYPVPPSGKVAGDTERILGDYLSRNPKKRPALVIMSKIAGRGVPYMRNGDDIKAEYITSSIDASLKRMQIDYMDVYQLHWPNRPHPHFNKHWPDDISHRKIYEEKEEENFLEVLRVLEDNIKAGKIREIGLSDETPWGVSKYIELSKKYDLPRMISVQNEFSLLHTKDWPYVIESCVIEDIAYLPWSPLAGGILSGKYLNNQVPEGSRWTFNQRHGIFRDTDNVHKAVAQYKAIADEHNMTCSQLSLAWCNSFDWVTSTIIGATKMAQLKEDIAAFDIKLDEETTKKINKVLRDYPVPF